MHAVGNSAKSVCKTRSGPSSSARKGILILSHDDLKSVFLVACKKQNCRALAELNDYLRDARLQDQELVAVLSGARKCISLVTNDLNSFVESILAVRWTQHSDNVIEEFTGFVLDLLIAHNYFTERVLLKLAELFSEVRIGDLQENDHEIPQDSNWYLQVHILLRTILREIPMSSTLLMEILVAKYPFTSRPVVQHTSYVQNLLIISEYCPHFRLGILTLIVNKLIILDVEAPKTDIEDVEDDSEDEDVNEELAMAIEDVNGCKENKCDKAMKHPLANTLDCLMKLMFDYIYSECYQSGTEVNWEKTKKLYQDLLHVFEKVILPTHASHHVQFLMFYFCSFKSVLAESFLTSLWHKISSPHVPPVIRRASVLYMASFLARAEFVPTSSLKERISDLVSWIHNYISCQEGCVSFSIDIKAHSVFYSVCQAVFYLIAFRHKDLVSSRKDLAFLQNLNLTKIITCRLNPLKACLPVIVQNFASVTRTYQLVYCYTVIEHNTRSTISQYDSHGCSTTPAEYLNTFFPYDPYVLRRSGKYILPIYRSYESSPVVEEIKPEDKIECEDDDFLAEPDSAPKMASSPSTLYELFSYGTSPGFKKNLWA